MTTDPFLRLHEDHEAIRSRLRALEAALDAAMARRRAEAAERTVFRETLAFLRKEVAAHMRGEEEALLPLLEARVGRYGTLVAVIAYDHEEIRRAVEKFATAVEVLEKEGDDPAATELLEVNRHGIFLVQYLGLHMAKEDHALAASARAALGPEGLDEVARRLEAKG